MKRLTKEQIKEIIRLREEGKGLLEVAKMFNLNPNTIKYHTEQDFRDKLIIYNREKYRKMSLKEKEKYFKRRKEYQKNYHKKRYETDDDFRKKQIERVKNLYRKKKK